MGKIQLALLYRREQQSLVVTFSKAEELEIRDTSRRDGKLASDKKNPHHPTSIYVT